MAIVISNQQIHDIQLEIKSLVESFDDEFGLPETAFVATRNLIRMFFGDESADKFTYWIEFKDKRCLLLTSHVVDCWTDIRRHQKTPA